MRNIGEDWKEIGDNRKEDKLAEEETWKRWGCQGRNFRGWRYRVIGRNYTPEWNNVLCQRGIILSDSIKKAPVDRQGHRSREWLVERSWLQLMYCTPVSSHEVGCIFRSDGSCQDRGPKEASEGVRVDKTRLGPDDINLQTEELYSTYRKCRIGGE